tara:strand:+ start:1155 stop:1328 length:174 start_codon:yes stop_codon:yes gene_type:complete
MNLKHFYEAKPQMNFNICIKSYCIMSKVKGDKRNKNPEICTSLDVLKISRHINKVTN